MFCAGVKIAITSAPFGIAKKKNIIGSDFYFFLWMTVDECWPRAGRMLVEDSRKSARRWPRVGGGWPQVGEWLVRMCGCYPRVGGNVRMGNYVIREPAV